MRLIGKKVLEKLKQKNKGHIQLITAINKLVTDIESNNWKDTTELRKTRNDADCVHNDGFYFFDIAVHRTMIMVEFEDGEATVVWAGDHQEYEATFKNNKNTIKKWLRSKEWIK